MGRYASRFELRLGDDDERALRDAAARFGMGRAELVPPSCERPHSRTPETQAGCS
jgi:hypothetical protein